jgi:hypothetical protein
MSTLGIAIGAREVSTGDGWERPLPEPTAPEWRASLTDALRALHLAQPSARALRIALLPPLADIRIAELPPLAPDRLRAVVARDAAKYLPVGDVPQTVQVRRIGSSGRGAFTSHLVSASPTAIVDAAHAAAEAAGFSVDAIVAAPAIWAAAGARRGNGVPHRTLVRSATRADVYEYAEGALRSVRRLAADAPPGDAAVLAPSSREATRLAAHAPTAQVGDALWPAAVASARAASAAVRRRAAVAVAMGVVALMTVALWWSAGRDLQQTQAARAAIAPQVAAAVILRDSLQRLDATVRALDAFSAGAPQWTRVITDVSDALPGDAWVSEFRATGDSLALTGEADHAGDAFRALLTRPTLTDVHTLAPMQQTADPGGTVTERFVIGARATGRGAATRARP